MKCNRHAVWESLHEARKALAEREAAAARDPTNPDLGMPPRNWHAPTETLPGLQSLRGYGGAPLAVDRGGGGRCAW